MVFSFSISSSLPILSNKETLEGSTTRFLGNLDFEYPTSCLSNPFLPHTPALSR